MTKIRYSVDKPKLKSSQGDTYSGDFAQQDNIREVEMTDLRSVEGKPDLDTDGFAYFSNRYIEGIERCNSGDLPPDVEARLEKDSIDLVKEL